MAVPSHALDDLCLLVLQAGGIALVRLLLTLQANVSSFGCLTQSHRGKTGMCEAVVVITHVVQAGALVILEQPVLAAEVAVAEAAVPRDALRLVLAVLEGASDLLGCHVLGERGNRYRKDKGLLSRVRVHADIRRSQGTNERGILEGRRLT